MFKTHKLATLSLALLIALTPAITSAKEKGAELKVSAHSTFELRPNKEEKKEDKDSKKEVKKAQEVAKKAAQKDKEGEKKCLKAFGHLIASGWKKNSTSTENKLDNCWLPFGIWKKLQPYASTTPGTTTPATTTPDVVAPIISNLLITTGTTTANITWNSNENASSTLYLSTSSPVNVSASSTQTLFEKVFTKVHSVSLDNLASSTVYHFLIRSLDLSGNSTTSLESSFTTK